jgi:hypothetical protein
MKFIVHRHSEGGSGYDFMVETESALFVWRMGESDMDALLSGKAVIAERQENRRPSSPAVEAPMSCDHGMVRIYDEGDQRVVRYDAASTLLLLDGKIFKGTLSILRMSKKQYCLVYERDPGPSC